MLIWGQFRLRYHSHQSLKLAWKIFFLWTYWNLPGANELRCFSCILYCTAPWMSDLRCNANGIRYGSLTFWSQNKMAYLPQTTFSNAFCTCKWSIDFDRNIIEICCHGSMRQYVSIGLDNGLGLNRRQSNPSTNDDTVRLCVYRYFGPSELNNPASGSKAVSNIYFFTNIVCLG